MFLHSRGVIYCDLKPSNILLDENGCMKLCDFGLARRLSDISKSSVSQLPQAKRGTPCYMAPELFQEGGVHSFASDFWALGCVLYECYAGRPPFVGSEFTHLVKSILSDPTPPLPDNPTRSFANLINRLLVKDPVERIQWPELCEHDFWRTKFSMVPLAPQPAFDDMVRLFARSCLSERNGERPSSRITPPRNQERDASGILRRDENSVGAAKGFETPGKNASGPKKAQTKASGIAVEENENVCSTPTKGVNLVRLSRIVKTNLQKENENENYRRPLSKASENENEVKLENTDMELDFGENNEENGNDESVSLDNLVCKTPIRDVKLPVQNPSSIYRDSDLSEENVQEMLKTDNPNETNMIVTDGLKTQEDEFGSSSNEVPATPPCVGIQRKDQRKVGSNIVVDSDPSKSSSLLSQALWHPSDLSVRPVMPSRKGDKASETLPMVPFDAWHASDFVKLSSEQMATLTSRIIASLNGNSPLSEKQNAIRYLEILSSNVDAANIITNGPIMLVLVKMLRLSKASLLRVQLVSVVGLLIRHSTFIDSELANSGIVGALADGLRDKQEKVRRFAMAALGELLFYISTQSESSSKEVGGVESPAKDTRSTPVWQVPSPLIAFVSSILRKGEDDSTQLYALRTIENICSQGGEWASRFNTQDVIANLCYIFKASGKQESMRLTAGSCLVRLVRFNPPSIQQVVEKLPFKEILPGLVKGTPKEQQISINLLNMAMFGSHMLGNMGRHLLSLAEEKSLVPSILSHIEHGTEGLRGKAFVFVALLCKNNRRWLPFFCTTRLLSALERMAKEKDGYVQQCMEAFVQVVASIVPGILESIATDIQQSMGGKRPGISTPSRTQPKNSIHLFPVIHLLLESSVFKHTVINSQILQQLLMFLKLLESSSFQGRDDFQITLLRIFESVTQEPSVVLEGPDIFISQVLPTLTILYKTNTDGEGRFLCLKLLFDITVIFLNETPNSSKDQREKDLKSISRTHFLSLYPALLNDEDPIPVYAQKLLVMLLNSNYIQVSDILHLNLISQCFEFLLNDLSGANVNNVNLCLVLASSPEIEVKTLSQLKVVRRIGDLLSFVAAKYMEDFLEPTLSLSKTLIQRAIGSWNIKDISDFGSYVGVFLELSLNQVERIADLASECISLLAKVAPREAATGVLTNIPKITPVLDSYRLQYEGSEQARMVLMRILHALGVSCREYRSQAMILSLSLPDIARIEAIISELKNSSFSAIVDAALEVAAELQRLPRCA
ncbi:serine/threonine-protein kinase RUNKEL isoform X2 [Amborella trichopoda]|uniref:serine/threonine-protein kinase RUNKEL isoform X2 n=1 Tax=Amborella trichopoda TaxID=13333 RepID=UPI0009BD2698|nr:serine/threonine-protein kinase RUNKEL isoform X2 [Amborella trichopoda]|eukprot:XP_020529810.1 serine/threonine-protein kinase RUNKEL isoform X2 [Amborella trichopoda]